MGNLIAVCGDIHLQAETPSKRIDTDYMYKPIQKIEKILQENDYLIVLGDLCNKSALPLEYIDFLLDNLGQYKGRIFSIIGNHDVPYRTMNLRKTAVGLLNRLGIINLKLNTFKLAGISFDVASVVPELKLPTQKSDILLGHFYIDNALAPKESLSPSDLSNYKHVMLGHDHCPYEPIYYNDTIIYRNGSLLRLDSNKYNLTRDVIKYIQIDNGIFKDKYLEVANPYEVFTPEVFNRPNEKIRCDLSNLDKLIANFKNNNSKEDNMSTLRVLLELNTPESSIEYLRILHESLGLHFGN
jgi:DNA repair exonuclease SbcCD nuclease subunit